MASKEKRMEAGSEYKGWSGIPEAVRPGAKALPGGLDLSQIQQPVITFADSEIQYYQTLGGWFTLTPAYQTQKMPIWKSHCQGANLL